MGDIRKRHPATIKMQVAVEALFGKKTVSEIAGHHKVHPVQVSQWKKQLSSSAGEVFASGKKSSGPSEALVSQLYEEIGRLKFELEWVKKSCQILWI